MDFTIFYNGLPEGWVPPDSDDEEEEEVEVEPEITIIYPDLENDEWSRLPDPNTIVAHPEPPPENNFGCALDPNADYCEQEVVQTIDEWIDYEPPKVVRVFIEPDYTEIE